MATTGTVKTKYGSFFDWSLSGQTMTVNYTTGYVAAPLSTEPYIGLNEYMTARDNATSFVLKGTAGDVALNGGGIDGNAFSQDVSVVSPNATSVDVSGLTLKYGIAKSLLSGCKKLTYVDLSKFATLTDISLMLADTPLLTSVKFGPSVKFTDNDPLPFEYYGLSMAPCSNGKIYVATDEDFCKLSSSQIAGTWTRFVEKTFSVSATRSTNGVADDDGNDITVTVSWATDATTTARTVKVYMKDAASTSWPSSASATASGSGASGNTTATISNAGDGAKDLRVEFYDGTTTYIAYKSVSANIRLVTVDEKGNIETAGSITSGGLAVPALKVLYDNESHAFSGAITLSESAANYKMLKVFYIDTEGISGSVDVYKPDGKRFSCTTSYVYDSHKITFKSKVFAVSGETIDTWKNSGNWYAAGGFDYGDTTIYDGDKIKITQVIGYAW